MRPGAGTAPVAWAAARHEVDFACGTAAGLARALGAMGLYRRGALARGDVPGFAPDYLVFKPWRARLIGSRTEAARGFAQGAWDDAAIAARDVADAQDRERIAEHNRALRDQVVFSLRLAPLDVVKQERARAATAMACFLADLRQRTTLAQKRTSALPRLAALADGGAPMVFLDTGTFEWMDTTGAARGEDLSSLAAWCWSCGVGRAAARLARLLRVELWTVPEFDRRIADADAQADAAIAAAAAAAKGRGSHVGA